MGPITIMLFASGIVGNSEVKLRLYSAQLYRNYVINRHFDMPLTTSRMKSLSSGLKLPKLKKLAVCGQYLRYDRGNQRP